MMHSSSIKLKTFAACIFLFGAKVASAQEQSISFHFQNVSLRNVLDTLIEKHRLSIVYLDEQVKDAIVSARCSECSDEEAMDTILQTTLLEWQKVGGQFMLKEKSAEHKYRVTIAGTVTDSVSGEIVVGSNVMLFRDSVGVSSSLPIRGCSTNKFGFYSLRDIEKGTYLLLASQVGTTRNMRRLAVKEKQEGSLTIDMKLGQRDIFLAEVQSQGLRVMEALPLPGTIAVSPNYIKHLPAIGGEVDLLRSLQLLPGVKSISEISSGLYVRGGSPDHNLYVLDGVTLYNPSHFGGAFGTFDSDAIKSVRLFKTGLSAEYGGRVGSVLDVSMREGTKERLGGSGGISMVNSRIMVEGPINDNATFMIAGRRVYFDLLLLLLKNKDARYYFYDLNAKVNYQISESDRVFASGYFGRDKFGGNFDGSGPWDDIFWGNATLNLRWTHIVSSSLFTNFSFIHTRYDYFAERKPRENPNFIETQSDSRIADLVLRGELEYFPSGVHKVKAGVELTRHAFGVKTEDRFNSLANRLPQRTSLNAVEVSLYAQDEWTLSERLTTGIGGRATLLSSNKTFVRVEPRLSLAYHLSDETVFSSSFGIAHQFLHSFLRSGVQSMFPTNIWFPSTNKVAPSHSIQATFGVESQMSGGDYLLKADAYYRAMNNIHEFRDNAMFSATTLLEDQIIAGKGKAYGVELFLQKQQGEFTGWIGYNLSWTTRQFPELNYGRAFYPKQDRRHELTAVFTYTLGERWEFGATWTFASGQPFTTATGIYFLNTNFLDENPYEGSGFVFDGTYPDLDYAERNGYRLRAYHRLDVTFIHKYSWFGLPFQISLNVYNAYNSKNPLIETISTNTNYRFSGYNLSASSSSESRRYFIPVLLTVGLSFAF